MEKNRRRYITGFDGLRTIGVIGVIMYHLNPNLFAGGYLGVPIFFCISGYLITDQLIRTNDNHQKFSLKNFYIKRLKRLYPALVLMMMTASSYIVLFQRNLLHNLHQIFITNILNVYNWWEIANGQSYFERFANNESPFTHLWTLSIEGQFYIIWPLLLMFLFRKKVKKSSIFFMLLILSLLSALSMAILFKPGIDPSRVYYGSDTRLFSILLGCALAVIWPSMRLKKDISTKDKRNLNILGAIAFIIMIWLLFVMKATSPFMYRGGMLIFSILTMILVAVVAHPAAIWNKLLSNKLFSYIGSRSYGLYLWQFPVMIFFESKFTNIADHPVLYPIIEVIIIVILADLAFRLVEKPMGSFNYRKLPEFFRGLLKARQSTKIVTAFCLLITVVGTTGLVQAVNTKAPNINNSKLAKEIKKNKKANDANNKKVIENFKKSDTEPQKNDNHYEQLAKDKPVNTYMEKYGISQVDLQRAQDVKAIAIGDSVMVDGSNDLKKMFPNLLVDAGVSRQPIDGINVLNDYLKKGLVPNVMIVGLGTNGAVSPGQIDQIMNLAGKKRNVYWINVHVPTRPWEKAVNNALYGAMNKYNNLTVIDWNNYAKDHPDWFYSDHVHPNIKGSTYYSTFIAKAILKNEK